MNWEDLLDQTLERPGMWVSRPYVDGLLTLWRGFSLGAQDDHFEHLSSWMRSERYPAPGGHNSPLTPEALVRRAITGETFGPLCDEDDSRAVALLADLVREHRGSP